MTTRIHRVPTLSDNYAWLFEYAPGTAAAIDPAEAEPVLAAARALGLNITHILNTHWHPDHVGGNLGIREATGCTIFGPAREAHPIPGMDRALEDGEEVVLGDHMGTVLFVGAHTAGHIAYHFPTANALFPGDTMFAMGCGRLFEGTPDDMFRALGKLKILPAETQVFCAHEYTLSNAHFAVTVEPENDALQRRFARFRRCVTGTNRRFPSRSPTNWPPTRSCGRKLRWNWVNEGRRKMRSDLRKLGAPLLLVAALAAAAPAATRPERTDPATLKATGEPVNCIAGRNVSSQPAGANAVMFRASSNRWFRNDLRTTCPMLRNDSVLVFRSSIGRAVLRARHVRHRRPPQPDQFRTCSLGKFTPVAVPKGTRF